MTHTRAAFSSDSSPHKPLRSPPGGVKRDFILGPRARQGGRASMQRHRRFVERDYAGSGLSLLRGKSEAEPMISIRSILMSAAFLLGATLAANAQQYQPPYNQAPAAPQSWSYDPYTSGLGPCTNWSATDQARCGDLSPPTYGQPTYRPPTRPGVYY
jgi:hypothetical protein